jgi:heterodisulfide reductase subunit A-like polyferredoxin
MRAHFNGVPMLESSGYLATVDAERCVGCGKCAKKCQFSAIHMDGGTAVVDAAECMGCGVCRFQCANDAISLVRNSEASDPLEIDSLMSGRKDEAA